MQRPFRVGFRTPALYPNYYAWYVLVSALDIMFTVTLLVHLGAREINMIAQRAIELFGTWGLIGLKFGSVILVIAICEYIGRRRMRMARNLALAAIFISLFPVVAAIGQVVFVLMMGQLQWVEWPPPDPVVTDDLDPFIPPGLL